MAAAGAGEQSLVYELTPEVAFSPGTAARETRHVVYNIGTILRATESRNVEYKTGGGNYPLNILPSHIQKYGSAFLNSDGGTLYVGISDEGQLIVSGRVVGLRLTAFGRQKVTGMIINEFNRFTPPVPSDLYMINFVPCNRQDHFVIEIHVKAGLPSEIYADREDKMWIRRDGSVQGPLWPREIREIVTTKFMKELADSSKTTKDSSTRPLAALSTATPVTQHHQRMT